MTSRASAHPSAMGISGSRSVRIDSTPPNYTRTPQLEPVIDLSSVSALPCRDEFEKEVLSERRHGRGMGVFAAVTLMREDAPQREYALRELFNALRYVVKTGCQRRFLPHDFPPWTAVYQQARRWNDARALQAAAHDLRQLIRLATDRATQGLRRRTQSRVLPLSTGNSQHGHPAQSQQRVGTAQGTLSPDDARPLPESAVPS